MRGQTAITQWPSATIILMRLSWVKEWKSTYVSQWLTGTPSPGRAVIPSVARLLNGHGTHKTTWSVLASKQTWPLKCLSCWACLTSAGTMQIYGPRRGILTPTAARWMKLPITLVKKCNPRELSSFGERLICLPIAAG